MIGEIFIAFVHWSRQRSILTGASDFHLPHLSQWSIWDRLDEAELSPQRGFNSRLCVRGQRHVRHVANFFRKLTRDLANVFELLHVSLAERAHEVMDPQLYPHHQREFFIHPER